MALTEKDLEKKTLSEMGRLVLGYEKKMEELAVNIRAGIAKPTDMLALNSELALIKKVQERKMNEQGHSIPKGQSHTAAPLKSYDDYLKSKK